MGWASGLAAGSAMGQDWLDTYKDSARQGGLTKANAMTLEELRAEQAANADQGLAAPAPVTGYKFGDQTFTTKPTPELLEAYRQEQRAKVTEQYGSAAEGQSAREKAVEQKAKAYKTIAETAYAQGTPEAIANAYSLINNGYDVRIDQDKSGSLTAWHYPEGQPDKATAVYQGDAAGFSDWAMKNSNPELFSKFADDAYKRENMALTREYRQGLREDRQTAQADRRTAQADRLDQQQAAQRQREYEALGRMAQQARSPEELAPILARLRQFDTQMAGLGGAAGGGGGDYSGITNSLLRTESKGAADWGAIGPKTRSGEQAYGRLQFMPPRLKEAQQALGVTFTPQEFLANPELQQRVEQWHFQDLDREIAQRGLTQYLGKDVAGQKITMDGLRAGAHLGGAAGLQKYLTTGGGYNPNDGRTAISDYVSFHANDDTAPPQAGLTYNPADLQEAQGIFKSRSAQVKPATALSPKDIIAIRQSVQEEVAIDPEFGDLPADAKAAEVERRFAEYMASVTGGGQPTTANTPEARMNAFRSILGLPQPKT